MNAHLENVFHWYFYLHLPLVLFRCSTVRSWQCQTVISDWAALFILTLHMTSALKPDLNTTSVQVSWMYIDMLLCCFINGSILDSGSLPPATGSPEGIDISANVSCMMGRATHHPHQASGATHSSVVLLNEDVKRCGNTFAPKQTPAVKLFISEHIFFG